MAGEHARERAVARHSSSTTDCSSTGRARRQPQALSARTAPTIADEAGLHVAGAAAVEPVAVAAAANGAPLHSAVGSGLTTSMWPLRISERPSAGPVASHVATTFALPSTPQLNGAAPGARERVGLERYLDRLQAELLERAAHDRLARCLPVQQRRRLDELAEQVHHRRLLGGDRGEDLPVHWPEPTAVVGGGLPLPARAGRP